MGFKDLSEVLDPGLKLPIRGKIYTIPAPSAAEGLRLRMLMNDPTTDFTDAGEIEEIMKLLGAEWEPNLVEVDVFDQATGLPVIIDDKDDPKHGQILTREIDHGTWKGGVWQEMSDDGLSWQEIMHAGRTAMVDIGQGRTMAELMWGFTGDDSAPFPPKPEGESVADPPAPNRAARRAKGKKKR